MSQMGQSRRFDRGPLTSGLPRLTDIFRTGRHASTWPNSDTRYVSGGDFGSWAQLSPETGTADPASSRKELEQTLSAWAASPELGKDGGGLSEIKRRKSAFAVCRFASH